jgi:tetraprenyl-beta-curcumene synthase
MSFYFLKGRKLDDEYWNGCEEMTTPQDRLHVPEKAIPLMLNIYKRIMPAVQRQLSYWKKRAEGIPNQELRKQALASIGTKQFHCEGGGIYALLAPTEKVEEIITFIVAYQTISDYLDNLCDRSTSLDPENFRALHNAMSDALSGNTRVMNYYEFQENQDDGGYLLELVRTCQEALSGLLTIETYRSNMLTLCQFYCDLQIYKHIEIEKREEALQQWWEKHKDAFYQLEWFEFAAASGSTLAIFYYAALASHTYSHETMNKACFEAYFPYVQGLHILLDYLIDQQEDRQGGDLNFCFYYPSEEDKVRRLEWFVKRAKDAVQLLPHPTFHSMVIDGLLGIYLADPKVKDQQDVAVIAKRILQTGNKTAKFFYYNGWLIHRLGKKV